MKPFKSLSVLIQVKTSQSKATGKLVIIEQRKYVLIHLSLCNRYLCECVTDRAAKLAGAGVAALANKINRPKLTVGMDGKLRYLIAISKELNFLGSSC